MMQVSSNTALPKPTNADTVDNGTIHIGGGFRLSPVEIADSARVRVGGGFRLPTA